MFRNKYITARPTKLWKVNFSSRILRGLYLWQFWAAQWPWLVRTVWEAEHGDPSHGALLLLENLGKNYNPPSTCGSAQNAGVCTWRRGAFKQFNNLADPKLADHLTHFIYIAALSVYIHPLQFTIQTITFRLQWNIIRAASIKQQQRGGEKKQTCASTYPIGKFSDTEQ